jgi:hypothetical protein
MSLYVSIAHIRSCSDAELAQLALDRGRYARYCQREIFGEWSRRGYPEGK